MPLPQILSRGKTDSASSRNASGGAGSGLGVGRQARKTPAPASLEDFIIKRDYTGARAFLEVRISSDPNLVFIFIALFRYITKSKSNYIAVEITLVLFSYIFITVIN